MTGKSMGMDPQEHPADDDDDRHHDKDQKPSTSGGTRTTSANQNANMFPNLPPVSPPPNQRPGKIRPYYGPNPLLPKSAISPGPDSMGMLTNTNMSPFSCSRRSSCIPASQKCQSVDMVQTQESSGESQLKLPPMSSIMRRRQNRDTQQNLSQTQMNDKHIFATSPVSGGRTNSLTPQMDLRMVYDNMMLGYFMPPPPPASHGRPSPVPATTARPPAQQFYRRVPLPTGTSGNVRGSSTVTHTFPTMQLEHLPSPPNSKSTTPGSRHMTPSSFVPSYPPNSSSVLGLCEGSRTLCNSRTSMKSTGLRSGLLNPSSEMYDALPPCDAMDINSSDCNPLETASYNQQQSDVINSLMSFSSGSPLYKTDFDDCEVSSTSVGSSTSLPSSVINQVVSLTTEVQSPTLSDISSVFLTPRDTMMPGSLTPSQVCAPMDSTTYCDPIEYQKSALNRTENTDSNAQFQMKQDSSWCRYSVLPPVMNSTTPSADDLPNYSGSQSGVLQSPFPPLNVSDISPYMYSSFFGASPRLSGLSSYSGRGSRNKRALSNSPLSAEGIDLNSIIRMSPTSLAAYITGSRSSSSCVSPGSAGERTGCYGHLSARNSSSSPNSGSGSSVARRSIPYTPQMTASSLSLQRELSNNANVKGDYQDIDNNLLLLQAMQALEESSYMNTNDSWTLENRGIIPNSSAIPESDRNLQVLPQNLAIYKQEELLNDSRVPYSTPPLPPVHTYQSQQRTNQSPAQTLKVPTAPGKPPPSYDQHMARKATLQKNHSSDSSQPSNYSSFESSEGDKLCVGSSSTDSEHLRVFACRWLDCTSVFHDQDEFVTHIEKNHIDQKKGEDFVCFWKACPRRMHPFNARYKLLVHMRVHSGDRPNKCTYSGCKKAFSRLENLKIHMRSHTGERPYTCTHAGCIKTFSNSSDRAKHQRTHQDTRPYVCQVSGCGKRYTDPSSLRKHAKSNHAEKKDPSRKKIRGGIEELDPNVVNECLVIKSIPPITHYDVSPPEPTDSGLGRSPRGSQPGSSSDHYPGLSFSSDTNSRSGTAQGNNSCNTSPSSYHSSPRVQCDTTERERLRMSSDNIRRVPLLPALGQSPQSGLLMTMHSPKPRPQSHTTPSLSGDSNSSLSIFESTNGNICLETLTKELAAPTSAQNFATPYYGNFSPPYQNEFPNENVELLPDSIFEALARFEGVS